MMIMWNRLIDILLRTYKPKYHFELIFLVLRLTAILVWLTFLIYYKNIALYLQLILANIIFVTDAMDGVISRRFTSPNEQYLFRILDALVDKIGIILFLTILVALDKISSKVFLIIICYNALLAIPAILRVFSTEKKELGWIQATLISRLYAFSVGITCLIACNVQFTKEISNLLFGYFILLSVISYISHIVKIVRLKRGIFYEHV